jgi:hypothetical protein
MRMNFSGYSNTATGHIALGVNSSGYENSAFGRYSLGANTTGSNNTAMGELSLSTNTTGIQNSSFGANSCSNVNSGSYNSALGYNSGPGTATQSNTTCLGIDAQATGSDMVRVGNTFVNSIGGYQNWTNISDGRFKENVSENVPGLIFISRLRPVTYRLNRDRINDFTGLTGQRNKIRELNPDAQFLEGDAYSAVTTGFIAQEVEEAARLAGFDFSGVDLPDNEKDLYGLRYAEFVVPLVKAVQEQQQQIEKLEARIVSLEKERVTGKK